MVHTKPHPLQATSIANTIASYPTVKFINIVHKNTNTNTVMQFSEQ